MGRRESCHPLLRDTGGSRGNNISKYRHGFSAAEMESLASICETVLPPLPLDSLKKIIRVEDQAIVNDVRSFWNTSASRYPIPHEVHTYIHDMCIY